ncbi:MAG: flagellar protein FlaG [Deltaproteobacteria bacterium]|nr:flagellar protein FlaG [Deltaproteobacteria bacterium]
MEAVGALRSQEVRGREIAAGVKGALAGKTPDPVKSDLRPVQTPAKSPPQNDTKKTAQATREKIERVAEAVENYLLSIQRYLKIQVHEDSGNIVVKVISKEDGKVIREIPSEEMLNLASRMEAVMGVLFDENV